MVNTEGRNTGTAFILTINEASLEFYEDIKQYFLKLSEFAYMLVTEHVGSSNKHYHMFVRKLHGAHIEKCYGSAQQNIDYCWARDEKHKDEGVEAILVDEIGQPKLKV
ncbi:hypothetical protein H8356DRAFT_1272051 [Neocallimastix lanati (nom. inval.)]|nr:hypothetical protein H8356DRAFT_1272051 [Neocallimastix sp. JGI-2020a]